MSRIPKYRADAKGKIAVFKADFTTMLSNVIAGADYFIFALEDVPHEILGYYADILTDAEMEACFRRATGHKSLATTAEA